MAKRGDRYSASLDAIEPLLIRVHELTGMKEDDIAEHIGLSDGYFRTMRRSGKASTVVATALTLLVQTKETAITTSWTAKQLSVIFTALHNYAKDGKSKAAAEMLPVISAALAEKLA